MADTRLVSNRFPRASQYHPDWIIGLAMGSHTLWLAEWLAGAMQLSPGMRVLDLGCGRAISSIFFAREFGVRVWAADLWLNPTENLQRIRDAGLEDAIYPLHVDARSLPFAGEFFDAIVCIDAYSYFGTDDLYLNYLAHFVKPQGRIGIAGAGLVQEIVGAPPPHLAPLWGQDFWAIHSASWWRRHWERTGVLQIETADSMPQGGQLWLEWQQTAHPENRVEIDALLADRGQHLTYIRAVGSRKGETKLVDYCWPDSLRVRPDQYAKLPLLRA